MSNIGKKAACTALILLMSITCFAKGEEKNSDFGRFFEGYEGAFVIYDVSANQYARYNKKRCETRFSPCSTFKIPNSMIGLETGVIPDENYVIKWDGKNYPNKAWNRDHTLRSAIEFSVVPYYRELAARVGEEKMKKFIHALHYGNEDLSAGLTKFWLGTSLKISADEQVDFLYRLYKDELPFSQRSIKIVKDIMKVSETNDYVLRGKTGTDVFDNGKRSLGWFVGYIVRNGKAYIFAANIEGAKKEANGKVARSIVEDILKSRGLM